MHKLIYVCVSVSILHLHVRVCLESQLHVWVQAAGAGGPSCTFCTEVGD